MMSGLIDQHRLEIGNLFEKHIDVVLTLDK